MVHQHRHHPLHHRFGMRLFGAERPRNLLANFGHHGITVDARDPAALDHQPAADKDLLDRIALGTQQDCIDQGGPRIDGGPFDSPIAPISLGGTAVFALLTGFALKPLFKKVI